MDVQPNPTKGKMRIHCLENVDKSLTFLNEQRVHLENMGAHDIVDGNPRLTLGLIWTIILRFQVPTSRTCRLNIKVNVPIPMIAPVVIYPMYSSKTDISKISHSLPAQCPWMNIEYHSFLRSVSILARDSIYAIARYMLSPVCPSVRPSVRHPGGSVKNRWS